MRTVLGENRPSSVDVQKKFREREEKIAVTTVVGQAV